MDEARYKIGTVAKMTGLSPFLLRAWENRHGLLKPKRSDTGLRFYSRNEVETLRAVKQLLDKDYTIGEVSVWSPERIREVAGTLAEDRGVEATAYSESAYSRDRGRAALFASARESLLGAAARLDRRAFDSILAEVAAAAPFDAIVPGLLVPLLEAVGEGWLRGEMSIASEHFITAAVRQRLAAMIQATAPPSGPLGLLACAPDDYHEIGALSATYLYARQGWAVTYLGANLPVEEFARAVERTRPELVGLSVVLDVPAETFRGWLETLAASCPPGTRRVCGGAGARRHASIAIASGFEVDATFELADRRRESPLSRT